MITFKKMFIFDKTLLYQAFWHFLKAFFYFEDKKTANFFEEISPLLLLFQPSDGQCDRICPLLIGSRYA